MAQSLPYHVETLKNEFQRRTKENPRYSMRAFAAKLRIHPSALCRIFAMKQRLSSESAIEAVRRLDLPVETARLFLRSVIETKGQYELQNMGEKFAIPNLRLTSQPLDAEIYAEVLNLTAHSILALTFAEDASAEPEWIAQRLGLPVEKVESTLKSLLALGLLRLEDGRLISTNLHYSGVKGEKTDRVRQDYQMSILDRAKAALERDGFDQRANYSVTMTIDPAKLPGARKMIEAFLENLSDYLEAGPRQRVYQAAIQLFNLEH